VELDVDLDVSRRANNSTWQNEIKDLCRNVLAQSIALGLADIGKPTTAAECGQSVESFRNFIQPTCPLPQTPKAPQLFGWQDLR
jgi:hypothetical protein